MVTDEDSRAIVRAAAGDMHCPAAGYCFIMGAGIEFTGGVRNEKYAGR